MKRAGFTLIELIAVLLLITVVGGIVGLMIGPSIQRYVLERDAAELNQVSQIALARITKELSWAQPDSLQATANGLQWVNTHPDRVADGSHNVGLEFNAADGQLLLNGNLLLVNVSAFHPGNPPGEGIGFTLQNRSGEITLTTTVRPRGP